MSMTHTKQRPELDNCTRDTDLDGPYGYITTGGGGSHG